jgi:sn-glycerol 3-phosphate transport system substrate-binding protein
VSGVPNAIKSPQQQGILPFFVPEEGTMSRRFVRVALAVALFGTSVAAQAQTEIQWWHSMGGALGEALNGLATKFNESQKEYKVVPNYKGQYPESLTAAIAAYRAGNAPHMLQVFEVGTATMMAAKGAIVPVAKVMADAKEPFDPKAYLPTVTGYYSDLKGNMLSFPFNSSTVMFYINKDAFKKAGLDPQQPPRTWKEVYVAALKLKASGQECVYTTSWPSWMHVENFSAWHNVPIGTKQNGMGGFDTEFMFNSPLHVRHISMLGDWSKRGLFTYAGRTNQGDAKFSSGECAMFSGSAGAQAGIKKAAKFDWSINFIPYHDDVAGAPQNSIIGGASVWVMGGKKPADYKGVAKFLAFLSRPEIQMDWHTSTGYVPITQASYDLTRKSGFYEKNPGADMPVRQLTNKAPTANSKGLRFGNFVQGREVIEEELEAVFAGKKDAKTALDTAVKRGNEILRKFEAANK